MTTVLILAVLVGTLPLLTQQQRLRNAVVSVPVKWIERAPCQMRRLR